MRREDMYKETEDIRKGCKNYILNNEGLGGVEIQKNFY